MHLSLLRVAVLAAGLSVSCFAGDWPQWRGPGRDSIAPDSPALAEKWPAGAPVKVWDSEPVAGGKDGGYGCVAVAGGRVFVHCFWKHTVPGQGNGAKPEKRGDDLIYCLDATTGRTLWKKSYTSSADGYGSSTPCVSGGNVYVVCGGGFALCLAAEDGREIWKTPVQGAGCSSFAVLDGVPVVFAPALTAFDAAKGTVLWTMPDVSAGNRSVAVWSDGGQKRMVCSAWKMSFVDAATHTVKWTFEGVGQTEGSPTVVDDWLVTMHYGGKLSATRLSAAGGKQAWILPFNDAGMSPLVYKGYVYALGNGNGKCIELETGRIMWEAKVSAGQCVSAIAADGKIFTTLGDAVYAQNGGSLVMLKATTEQ